jgi:hypothetical protein
MPTLNETRGSQTAVLPPPAASFDERAWQAWLTRGRLQDERRARTRLEAVKIVSILSLFAAAAFWPYVAPYEVVLRFAVTIAAGFVMLHAVRSRHYVLATLLGATALLYNPVVQLFAASGEFTRVLLVMSATPFILSLDWWNTRRKA